ncbi:DUF5071 domain-containing protein [Lysinibacillus sp. SGAir0095]|uniref:DUF5071 domain-containing protein n=1 Tax=Lysinibacillus sp. SGAir0095 TaxID=2070463 RepID=UPI00143DAC5B|nr:DUF5071 domain-containing protein [Lysinibacillus sp. SGAir0095]
MEKTVVYFLELADEQLIIELPALFQLVKENKIMKTPALATRLLRFPNEITPFIFELFESDSEIAMKEWSLDYLVPGLPFFVKIALEDVLQRIAQSPNEEEKLVKLDEKANSVLSDFI